MGLALISTAALAISSMPARAAKAPTLDELFQQVARQAPGFGGAYFDAEGQLTVYIATTAKVLGKAECSKTIDALADVLGKQRLQRPLGDPRDLGAREPERVVEQLLQRFGGLIQHAIGLTELKIS